MCERQYAIICAFGLRNTNMSAYEIRKRIYAFICLNCQEATMVLIDGPKRHVHINFRGNGRMRNVLNSTGRQVEYQHSNCEMPQSAYLQPQNAGVIPWTTYDIMVVMIQATLIMRAQCDGVGRRRYPYPTQYLSVYSLKGDRKNTAISYNSKRG